MNAKVYIPYIDYDPETGFTTDMNLSGEDYVNYLNKEYASDRFFLSSNGMQYNGYGKKEHINQRKDYKFYELSAKIYSINGDDETIDNLLNYYKTHEVFAIQIDFKNLYSNEDAFYEMNTWFKESYAINSSDRITDDIKIKYLPIKDLKLSFGENSSAIIKNCKLLDRYDKTIYVLLVDEIIFVN